MKDNVYEEICRSLIKILRNTCDITEKTLDNLMAMPRVEPPGNEPGPKYVPGDTVTVALEGPGPGTRDPRYLHMVTGTVTDVEHWQNPDLATITVLFEVTPDTERAWLALMPDYPQDVEVGKKIELPEINPDWVVSHGE